MIDDRSAPFSWPCSAASWSFRHRVSSAGSMPMARTVSALRMAPSAWRWAVTCSLLASVVGPRSIFSLASASPNRMMAETSAVTPSSQCSRNMMTMKTGAQGASNSGPIDGPPMKARICDRSRSAWPPTGAPSTAPFTPVSTSVPASLRSNRVPIRASRAERSPSIQPRMMKAKPAISVRNTSVSTWALPSTRSNSW